MPIRSLPMELESTDYSYIDSDQIQAFENTIAVFIEKSLI
jgi:hypothetical protein